MTAIAISKIKKELAETKGDRYVEAVKKPTADALIHFCRQDTEFAQAVVQSEKPLSDCLKLAMKGCGSSVSAIDVYRKAAQFYFPGADVRMTMTIDLCASVRDKAEAAAAPVAAAPAAEPKAPRAGISLDLTDFL